MKLLIISAGPGIDQIRDQYGHATDWISNLVTSSNIQIDINNANIKHRMPYINPYKSMYFFINPYKIYKPI